MSRVMKDSGIEWIGEIPFDWEVVVSKSIFIKNDGGVWGNEPTGNDDTMVLRSTEQNIEGKLALIDPAYRSLGHTEKERALLQRGDIIITKSSGSSDHIGKASLVDEIIESKGCCFSNFLQRIKVRGCPEYFWYLFNYSIARDQYGFLSTTTTGLNNITAKTIGSIKLPLPTYNEQLAISKYLNERRFKIDQLIALQEEMIKELQAYKQSVITEAVTKGLDPDVPLKDSGLEWTKSIPFSWKAVYLSSVFSERKHKNRGLIEKNLLSLSYGRVKRKDINTKEGLLPESFDSYNIVEEGDIVLRLTDLQNDKRSLRSGLCMERGIITSAYITIKPTVNLDTRYMHYYLHAFDICKGFYGMGDGVRQSLNYDELKKLLLLFPPIAEQQAIAEKLSNICIKIDQVLVVKQSKIDTLKELKKSLIYECVTGKRDCTMGRQEDGA